MSVSHLFMEQVKDLFQPFGEIRIRKMFGGAGVYCDDLFFAVLDDGVIYLKVDETTRPAFEAQSLSPFTFETKGGSSASLSYYNAPVVIFDDADELYRWTTLALDAAARAKRRP